MSAYDKQIGGTHYRKMKIQPSKFVIENKLLSRKEMLLNIFVDINIKEERKTY